MTGGNIFLNYRRDDTEGYARLIHRSLDERFPNSVFRDVRGIAPGANFVREIERKLETCHVILVLIGKDWLTLANAGGVRRLDDARDFVRIEIATGLRRGIPVIPILVEGARMPDELDLPDDLKPLAHIQAMPIIDRGDDDDLRPLIRVLERMFGVHEPRPEPEPVTYPPDTGPSPWKTFALITTLGVGAVVILFVALGAFYDWTPTQPEPVEVSAANSRQPNVAPDKVSKDAAASKQSAPSAPTAKAPPGVSLSSAGNAPAGNAPAGNAPTDNEEEGSFEPAGTWKVTSPDNSGLYTVYWLTADRRLRFETMTAAGELWMSGQGTWDYQLDEQVLSVSGRMANGQSFRNTIRILGGDGNNYAAHDTKMGRITFERLH